MTVWARLRWQMSMVQQSVTDSMLLSVAVRQVFQRLIDREAHPVITDMEAGQRQSEP